jgi:hypothetical protein
MRAKTKKKKTKQKQRRRKKISQSSQEQQQQQQQQKGKEAASNRSSAVIGATAVNKQTITQANKQQKLLHNNIYLIWFLFWRWKTNRAGKETHVIDLTCVRLRE